MMLFCLTIITTTTMFGELLILGGVLYAASRHAINDKGGGGRGGHPEKHLARSPLDYDALWGREGEVDKHADSHVNKTHHRQPHPEIHRLEDSSIFATQEWREKYAQLLAHHDAHDMHSFLDDTGSQAVNYERNTQHYDVR